MKIDCFSYPTDISNPLISLLEYYRESEIPNQDELLLQSAGPVTDLAKRSYLPCIDSIRILFFEPQSAGENQQSSALKGNINLNYNDPLVVLIQEFQNGRWNTVEELEVQTLEMGINLTKKWEISFDDYDGLPIIPGGFTGLLGYDLNRWSVGIKLQNIPSNGTLLGVLWRADAWWVHERESRQLKLVSVSNHHWIKEAKSGKISLVQPNPCTELQYFEVPESESDSSHANKVDEIKTSIRQGHLYQLNYGRKWEGKMPDHPWNAFQRMMSTNPSPFASWLYVHDHGWSISSASPERLLKTENGIVSTRPIKGTYPRGKSIEEDKILQEEMASSEKEIAEHLMLVDLKKHDLSKICQPGTVHWSDFRIEALPTVQHLVSGVTGKLNQDVDFGKIISALFPGGSITGCPKIASIAAINEIERGPRGAWTGSIGHFHSLSGISEFNILIRTLESHSGPTNWYGRVQAGGGIVVGSQASSEVEEARWKATAITDATWGFRTGFSIEDLPKRTTEMVSIPKVEGPVGEPKPKAILPTGKIGHIIRGDIQSSIPTDVLLIDNLDSFTENIANCLVKLGKSVRIVEGRPKEQLDSKRIVETWLKIFKPKYVIIGPGPSRPEKSQITMEISKLAVDSKLTVDNYQIPILGLCLGHQALGLAVGWELIESPLDAVHGVPSIIIHDNKGLYSNQKSPLILMRYNSLVLKSKNESMICTAFDETGTLIMGMRHQTLPIFGIQFHPESVGSPLGLNLISTFLKQEPILIDSISHKSQVR
ncbi:MAG: chorismate-binding protein [Candidatus Thalassarchaeaceae archaeon]|nr:chorismate-binding protein [Candidatus Thalassarchaeaceae archaeon]|tara:strand:+ start:2768 stop:5071 length:2304 start_codon:yes stop_codon:yes gene_type:complete